MDVTRHRPDTPYPLSLEGQGRGEGEIPHITNRDLWQEAPPQRPRATIPANERKRAEKSGK